MKIKVIVDARRQAHVTWGRKDFGVAPLEIERPRNSGPLDLVVVAPGYLPLHARALTDRDEVLSLRLYSAAEAPQLLGYRPEAALAPESGSASVTDFATKQGRKSSRTRQPTHEHGEHREAALRSRLRKTSPNRGQNRHACTYRDRIKPLRKQKSAKKPRFSLPCSLHLP